MIDLGLVKRDMLGYVQDVRPVGGMGRAHSDLHVVLYKVKLMVAWIKRREVVVGLRGLKAEN